MRIYRLSPRCTHDRLLPHEVLDRFTAEFSYVQSDYPDADSLGLLVIASYERTSKSYKEFRQKFDWLPDDPPSLETMDQKWRDAIHMHVWIDHAADQRFSAIVTNDPDFEIVFSDTVMTKLRRDTADYAASLLNYDVDIVDEPDYVDRDQLATLNSAPRRAWWRFW